MVEKKGKVAMLTQGNQEHKSSVFDSSMFQMGGVMVNEEKNNTPKLQLINLDDIDIETNTEKYDDKLKESVKERLVTPIILSQIYEEKEKGGRKFRAKTGRYQIIDGNKRVNIYNDLKINDIKYNQILSLVLPLDTNEEDLNAIKNIINNYSTTKTEDDIVTIIGKTSDQEIEYCYTYELAQVDINLISERDNKYPMRESEIMELAKSILNVGLIQPIVLLPYLDEDGYTIKYQIQAGHKRMRAIRQLLEDARQLKYTIEIREKIRETFKTVPALLIPMGAKKAQVEKVYHDTNLLSRHLTTDEILIHLDYFEELPPRPHTEQEYYNFISKKYRISRLVSTTQLKFKMLGFSDWKNTKTTSYLNIYYYGSDKLLEAAKDLSSHKLTLKDLTWIATKYKEFYQRKQQDELLDKVLHDRSLLLEIIDGESSYKINKKYSSTQVKSMMVKEKIKLQKLFINSANIVKKTDKDREEIVNLVEQMEEILDQIRTVVKK